MSSIAAYGRARKRIRPRIERAPVNRAMVMAGVFGTLSWACLPASGGDLLEYGFSGISGLLAAAVSRQGLANLLRDYRLRYALAVSELETTDHGSARQSTKDERAARGMAVPDHGELFGLDDDGNPVWRPRNAFLTLVEMPPGVGKTSMLVMGSVLHRARLGCSIVVPDVKAELAAMLAPHLLGLGYEVWCLNPAGQRTDLTGNTEIGLYQPLIDALYGDDEERRKAVKIAADFAALHHPMKGDEKQPFFGYGSRRAILVAILLCAYLDPAHCTPTAVYELLTDPAEFLKYCRKIQKHQNLDKEDRVLEVLKREARNLLHRADKNEENFGSFLEGASQKFISFNPSGLLGHYGAGAIHSLGTIRDRQIIVFIVTPLSAMREFGDFISLVNHNIVAAVKGRPDGHPVHIVGEEALNYRFSDLVSDLETLRQLRVTIDLYIQSFAGLEIHYGKAAAAAIESYADIRIYAGLNSFERAKYVSGLLSELTIGRQALSFDATVREIGISNRELGRPMMKTNEVLAMPRNQAWMFVNGLHPVRLTMLSYAQVSPWRDAVGLSPITGTRLHADAVLRVEYPAREMRDGS